VRLNYYKILNKKPTTHSKGFRLKKARRV
jgi:hypothetical protein